MTEKFRLASLLRVRRLQEDEAAAALASANRAAAEARQRSARASARLAGAALDDSVPVGVWQAITAARATMRRELEDAEALVHASRAVCAEAERAWLAARTRVKTFERLEEQHAALVAAAELAEEQKALDEAAGRRPTTHEQEDER